MTKTATNEDGDQDGNQDGDDDSNRRLGGWYER